MVEYTGVAIGFQMFGVSPRISVPVAFLAHLLLVYRRKYAEAEKPLLIISVFFSASWIASAVLTARNGIQFTPFYFESSPNFFLLLAANVGAVIMPFMLFYQASATAEKGITRKSLWAVRIETGIGALVSELIMVAILVATVGVSTDSLQFAKPEVLSRGLVSVAGNLAPSFFGIGLIAAAFIALIVISLGSCWGVTEALGWGRKYWFRVYLVESIPALVVPLLSFNLINLAISLMVLQIVVLIGPALTLGLLASNKKLMGEHAMRGFGRVAYWVFLVLIFGTGVVSMVYQL